MGLSPYGKTVFIVLGLKILIGIGLALGWVQSVYKCVTSDFDPINKREIVYGLGIVIPPVGE